MKRLIMISVMLIFGVVQCKAADQGAHEVIQSSHDTHSKIGEDAIAIANVHHIDLDTTEMDGSGNWWNKRIWYEKSQTIFDEIRNMVGTLGDVRMQFSNEVNVVGQKIDLFFETVGFEHGELKGKFQEYLTRIETEQKLVGDVSPDEHNAQISIKEQLVIIDQLEKDMKSIGEVDTKIQESLMQAFKTINECRDYETQSWDAFKAISKELDDKKARNFYYQMSNYKQNIEQKTHYLQTTLLPYLHNVLVAKIDVNISKINDTIVKLKDKGVDLEKIMSKSLEDDITRLHEHEQAAIDIAVSKALEDEQLKFQQAEAQAAKALQDAQQKSFSNVVHTYYQATFGKIIEFVYQGIIGVREYVHGLVHNITTYFNRQPVTKKVITDAVTEKVEENVATHQETQEQSKEHDDHDVVPVQQDTQVAKDDAHSSDEQHAAIDVVSDSVSQVPAAGDEQSAQSTTSVVSVDKNNVEQVVDAQEKSPNDSHIVHRMFQAIVDLLRAIIMAMYNCVIQFFTLLMQFSAYVMSGN